MSRRRPAASRLWAVHNLMPQEPLEIALEAALGTPLPAKLGVAVSGGGDSLALLHLLARIYARRGGDLQAVTVDHGLREGSAAEAEHVAAICADMGLQHQVFRWENWDRSGNLQDAARQARYHLMADWAKSQRLNAVALGHTADDQAETVLLRLGRRSGVDGLSAMAPRRHDAGMLWLRPMLGITRLALRDFLTDAGFDWIDDPSNEDTRFDRIKARHAMGALEALGIDTESLGVVAENMAEARNALESYATLAAQECLRLVHGAIVVRRDAFATYPPEVQRRVLRRALDWIAPAPYPPRRAGLAQLMQALAAGEATTLAGCALVCRKDDGWLFREFYAVADHVAQSDGLWDGRWRCFSSDGQAMEDRIELRAISSNGLKKCSNWRELGLPRGVLLSHPGLWHGDTLLSSPAVKTSPNWRWELARGADAFLLS
ncbi:tRNA lysidine(34) synthetase TilS [Sulfitobacter sp.]|uniref:tRNA lysidine(34) synthetase TilS n=1 Tax=Sulfitobacter sp. TaxID=1903071 RepID=UPI0030021FF4